jgi:hypothetical protein
MQMMSFYRQLSKQQTIIREQGLSQEMQSLGGQLQVQREYLNTSDRDSPPLFDWLSLELGIREKNKL